MNLRKILLSAGLVFCTLALAETYLIFHMKDGSLQKVLVDLTNDALSFTQTHALFQGQEYALGEIDHVTLLDEESDPATTTLRITWEGEQAPTIEGHHPDVTVTADGGNVTLTNSNTTEEFTYILAGQSAAGSFTLISDYKSTIQLDGVSLQSTKEEALNLKCGKRVALIVTDGTQNTLADATTDNGQKAALYCKGHLELSGAGSLALTGHVKHGLSTKEYLQLKKTFGSLTVTSAAADGIHAGQYYQQNGGSVTISKVGGDGIQAEATGDETKEMDGQLIVKGGVLTITTTATDVAALKSDSLMTLSGGTYTLTTSGAGNKAIKSKQELTVSGGEFTIQQSGKACIENGDLGYVTALKGTDVLVSGGKFTITTSGAGARGISAGNLTVSDEADIKITNTGAAGTASDAVEVTSTPDPTPEVEQKSYKVYVAVPTSSSGGGGRPGQQTTSAWSSVYLYKSDGTQLATLTQKVTVNNVTFYCYDFGKADTGTYYFGAPNYSSGGGWGGGTSYTIKSGTFSGPSNGKDYYYQISTSYSTSGTTRTYSISNVTSQYEGGTIGGTSSSDAFTAKGFKVDGNAYLLGGTINISVSGAGGKGIKVEGNYIQGIEDGSGPMLTIATTGAKYGSTGGSTGGWGGGRPGEDSSGSSAKAIKAQGTVIIYGGQSEISTATDGAEGLESKVAQLGAIRILGGQHYFRCYDDCINSAGGIDFDGGVTVCYGYGNDAVDSNYGRSGAIRIGNGSVLAYTTKGSPEEGLDCDNNSYIQITGTGNAVSLGGAQGGGGSSGIGSATQGYYLGTSSISITSGRYYTLADSSGKNMITFSTEANISSTMSLFTATGMKSGSSYTLKYNTSAPTDAQTAWHGLYLGSTATGTTSVTTMTAR